MNWRDSPTLSQPGYQENWNHVYNHPNTELFPDFADPGTGWFDWLKSKGLRTCVESLAQRVCGFFFHEGLNDVRFNVLLMRVKHDTSAFPHHCRFVTVKCSLKVLTLF
jgi:hypothetical protein